MDCLFCKIVRKELPARIAYEDRDIMAFHDIMPKAPIHILIIPKIHIPTINEVQVEQADLVGRLILTAQQLAEEQQCSGPGYRLVFNVNEQAGQTVFHVHLHLLGGRSMTWPPG